MKVLCLGNTGRSLLAVDMSHDPPSATFDITLGKAYNVYGLVFEYDAVKYLILSDHGRPHWCRAALFRVECNKVSRHWRFASWPLNGRYFAVATFPQFVASKLKYNDLYSRA